MNKTFLRLTIFFTGLFCVMSCEQEPRFHDALRQVIEQHYTDLPTYHKLKPVWLYAEWIKGQDSTFHRAATNVAYWSFPAPPDDTVVTDMTWLRELTQTASQLDFSAAYVKELIRNVYSSDGLSDHNTINLLEPGERCLTYADFRAPERSCQPYYYYFSEPICNETATVCWVNVDKLLGDASVGLRVVYQLQGDQWVKVYTHTLWIS